MWRRVLCGDVCCVEMCVVWRRVLCGDVYCVETCVVSVCVCSVQMCERVNGASYDVEYDTGVVRAMGGVTQFSSVSAALDRAIYLKRELDTRRRPLLRTVDSLHTTPPSHITHTPPPPPRNYGSITDSGETIQPKTFN